MTFVVTDNCVDCKYTDCVLVCPVDCFYETDKQLVIHPEECIDCGACVPECPVEAIFAEDDVPEEMEAAIEFNASEIARLEGEGAEPITEQKEPLPTAAEKAERLGFA